MGDDFKRTDGAVHRKDPPRVPPEPASLAEMRAGTPMPMPELRPVPARVVSRSEIVVHACVLPYRDLDASLAFYRDLLGWVIRARADSGTSAWVEVAPPTAHAASVVLVPFSEYDGESGIIHLATGDSLDGVHAAVLAAGGDVVQKPKDHPWGVRDLALRDPAGNTVRIRQR